jgi:hypothetical protein
MRAGVWLALLGLTLPLGSCSGGYPLPPTRCDEWCDTTKGAMCDEYYSPASCVVQCEQADLDNEQCRTAFDATLACFRASPNALSQRCVYDAQQDDCDNEVQWLMACAGGQLFDNVGQSDVP